MPLFGGGAYISFSNHLITFQSCDFIDNWSQTHSGGLHIDVVQMKNYSTDGTLEVTDCFFHQNTAQYGGAAYILFSIGNGFHDSALKLTNPFTDPLYDEVITVRFRSNVFDGKQATEIGAAFAVASRDFFMNMEQAIPIEVNDW